MPQVEFKEFIGAPVERVFAFFADHEQFGLLWPGQIRRTRAAPDPAQPNGLGSVRQIKPPGLPSFDEEIVVFEPGQRIEYTVTRGSPIKNHRGVILFRADAGGTRLDYTIRFEPRIPGMGCLICAILRRDFARGLARLRPELERSVG